MTLTDLLHKSNRFVERVPRDALVVTVLVVACIVSFGLGFLAGRDLGQQGTLSTAHSPISSGQEGQVVASKSGTKYFLPWCAGAEQISESNRVYFNSAEAARREGYEPAANCKGL